MPNPIKHSSWMVVAHGSGKDRKYLVGKRGKKANNAGQWGFFGGTNDPGEHPRKSALREFHEESGHKLNSAFYMGIHKTEAKHNHYFFHRSATQFIPKTNYETAKTAWVSGKDLKKLNLHSSVKHYFDTIKPKKLAAQKARKAAGSVTAKLNQFGYKDMKYNTDSREKAANKGQALPDGSFPIKDATDLASAVRNWGRASDPAKAKRWIIKRARALKIVDKLPEKWAVTARAATETNSFFIDHNGKHIPVNSHGHEKHAQAHVKKNNLHDDFHHWSKHVDLPEDKKSHVNYMVDKHKWVRGLTSSDYMQTHIPKEISHKTASTLHRLSQDEYSRYSSKVLHPGHHEYEVHDFYNPDAGRKYRSHITQHVAKTPVTAKTDPEHHWKEFHTPLLGTKNNGNYEVRNVKNEEGHHYNVYNGAHKIAHATLSNDKTHITDVHVNKEHQRNGIATALYKHIESKLGYKLKRSPTHQTPDGKAFWNKTTAAVIPEIGGKHNGITYDQKNGLGNVPHNQEINNRGFSVYMKPSQFLKLVPKKTFDENSSIKHVTTAVTTNKPIASPYLDVNFDRKHKKPATVTSHEGRTRMQAISQVHGDIPVLVHVFAGNNMRAKDLTPAHIKAFQQAAVPEKQKKVISGKHFDDNIHIHNDWHNINNLPPHLVKAEASIDKLSKLLLEVSMSKRSKVEAAKVELGLHHLSIEPDSTYTPKWGKYSHAVKLKSGRKLGFVHPAADNKWDVVTKNKIHTFDSLEDGAMHLLKAGKPQKYELNASDRELETTAFFGALKRGLKKLDHHLTANYHKSEANHWNKIANKAKPGSEDHTIATNAANKHAHLQNVHTRAIVKANNHVKGSVVPSVGHLQNQVEGKFGHKSTEDKASITHHLHQLYSNHAQNRNNTKDGIIHYHSNQLKKLTGGTTIQHPKWAPKLKHPEITQPHPNAPKTPEEATQRASRFKIKQNPPAKKKQTSGTTYKPKTKTAKPGPSPQDIKNKEREQRLMKKHNVSPEDQKNINGEPSSKASDAEKIKYHSNMELHHANEADKASHRLGLSSFDKRDAHSADYDHHKNQSKIHQEKREELQKKVGPKAQPVTNTVPNPANYVKEPKPKTSVKKPASKETPAPVKQAKSANTNTKPKKVTLPDGAKEHQTAINQFTKTKAKHVKVLNGIKDAMKNGDLDKTALSKLKKKHTERFNTIRTINNQIKHHTGKLNELGVKPKTTKAAKKVVAASTINEPKRGILRSI